MPRDRKPSELESRERTVYEDVWDTVGSDYGEWSPGLQCLAIFQEMSGNERGTILDAGCGTGKCGLALEKLGFTVTLADITKSGLVPEAVHLPFRTATLWNDLRPIAPAAVFGEPHGFDYVYCADVMEHIPTALTMTTIQNLCAIAKRGVFLTIAFLPDRNGLWVGRPLHLTVQSFVWWRDHLQAISTVLQARDLVRCGVFYLEGQAR